MASIVFCVAWAYSSAIVMSKAQKSILTGQLSLQVRTHCLVTSGMNQIKHDVFERSIDMGHCNRGLIILLRPPKNIDLCLVDLPSQKTQKSEHTSSL